MDCIDAHYSSDDEIAWGPLTLREIKSHFRKPEIHEELGTNNSRQRCTNIGGSTFDATMSTFLTKMSDLKLDEPKPNSSTQSAYFTPDETFQKNVSGQNELYRESSTKVIDKQPSGMETSVLATSYTTALDTSFKHQDDTMLIISGSERSSCSGILVDTTALMSDDEVKHLSGEITIKEISESDISADIILINDSNNDCSDVSEMVEEPKKSNFCVRLKNRNENFRIAAPSQNIVITKSAVNDNDSYEQNSPYDVKEAMRIERNHGISVNEKGSKAARHSNESICGTNRSGLFQFNDTMEEMEMALEQGLNYVMPGDDNAKQDRILTGSIINTNTELFSLEKPKVVGTCNKKKMPVHCTFFKVPINQRRCTRTPSKSSFEFKDIVSPVGIYIKNSPGVCLKQNVPAKTIPRLVSNKSFGFVRNKENVGFDIPEVIYRPPRKTITSSTKSIVLPNSIQNMVQKPTITVHEKRTNKHVNKIITGRKLMEGNLTFNSVDSSLLNQSHDDVSFLTNKQAFIK